MKQKLFRSIAMAMICLALIVVGLGLYFSSVTSDKQLSGATLASEGSANSDEIREVSASAITAVSPPFPAAARRGTPSLGASPWQTAVSSRASELVMRMSELVPGKEGVSPEQARMWQDNLQYLMKEGAAAIPAIREYLAQNVDINYRNVKGGEMLGYASLRTALLNVLGQTSGPESLELMSQTLSSTAVPAEVALLAQFLERQAPGQYREQAMSATTEILNLATQGQLVGWDVGPLFRVVQDLAGAEAVSKLENLGPQWKFYSAMSLAALSEGEGVQGITRQLQDPQTSQNDRDFVFQVLAQISPDRPEASAALLAQVRQGQLSESTWRRIIAGLAGDQFSMVPPSDNGRPELPTTSGTKAYHVDAGNQNFYSVPVSAVATAEQLAQRRNLIDQLIAAGPGPEAVQLLKDARTLLNGVIAAK